MKVRKELNPAGTMLTREALLARKACLGKVDFWFDLLKPNSRARRPKKVKVTAENLKKALLRAGRLQHFADMEDIVAWVPDGPRARSIFTKRFRRAGYAACVQNMKKHPDAECTCHARGIHAVFDLFFGKKVEFTLGDGRYVTSLKILE